VKAARKPEVVDSKGRSVVLGKEIGRGGEGAVYEVEAGKDFVAKIYHHALSAEKADKIRTMVGLRTDAVANLAAWPVDLLCRRTGEPIGLVMPRVVGRKDIHHLYSPKSRRADFQRADWRFLVRAAANTARAFAAVHDAGCVIGDVNHGGVLVAQDATVRLIDCDSFQVSAAGRRYLCEVGVETFTPPELQGRPFKGVVRTPNHDNFGLAVMAFLILFMGRHPFAGRYLGPGDMPIPRAIEENRFAYGAGRAGAMMQRPPGTPDLDIVGSEVAALFERAFSKQTVSGGRPSAREWVAGLEQLEKSLKQCAASPSHWLHRSLGECPWCRMEGSTGVSLFPLVVQGVSGGLFDLESLWRQVEALPSPGPVPDLPEIRINPSADAEAVRSKRVSVNVGATLVAVAMIGAGLFGKLQGWGVALFFGGIAAYFTIRNMFGQSEDVSRFKSASEAATTRWHQALADWRSKAGPGDFDAKKAAIDKLRSEWAALPNIRLQRLEQLERDHRAKQLEHFLDGFEIETAKISGIGPARKRTLESFGIETAADIELSRLALVQGIGPSLQSNLLQWRRGLEGRFRFDPNKPIDARDIAQVEQGIIAERQGLEARIRTAVVELKQTHARIAAARQHMRPTLEAVQRDYAQAEANYDAAQR